MDKVIDKDFTINCMIVIHNCKTSYSCKSPLRIIFNHSYEIVQNKLQYIKARDKSFPFLVFSNVISRIAKGDTLLGEISILGISTVLLRVVTLPTFVH